MSKPLLKYDPFFEKFFESIPPEVSVTFTDAQFEAIKKAFCNRSWKRHTIDIRFSLPFPKGRFYTVLLAGSERRSNKRIKSQKSSYPLWTPINTFVIILSFVVLVISLISIFQSIAYISSIFFPSSTHPAVIPWINNQAECEKTGRIWRNGGCLESEHSPTF
jgi:hypothetical protein